MRWSHRYPDRARVQRHGKIKMNGETVGRLAEVYASIPCRLSQTGLARNGQTSDTNRIEYDAKLFMDPEWEIRQGDVIEVTRPSRRGPLVFAFTAGEPFPPYPDHQEIRLTRKDRA